MDGFEINKILGAVLGTALLIIGIGNVANAVYRVEPLTKDAYPVEVAAGGTAGGAPAAAAPVDIGTALGSRCEKGRADSAQQMHGMSHAR